MIPGYLITDPLYYSSDLDTFKSVLKQNLQSAEFALYRDKQNQDYEFFAKEFVFTCKDAKVKPILHKDFSLALKLGAYGVHLPFIQLQDVQKAKDSGLFTVVSTHTLDEAKTAKRHGADAITFSPIFYTPNKAKPVGLAPLKDIVDTISIKVIALGGILDDSQIEAVEKCGAFAYASIRKFIKG